MVRSPCYRGGERGVPVLDVAASHDREADTVSFSLVNRDQQHELEVDVNLADRRFAAVLETVALGGGDVKAANNWDAPDRVAPVLGSAEIAARVGLRVWVRAPGLAVVRAMVVA